MTKDPTAALALGVNESYTLETGQALVAPPGCWMMVVPDVPIGKELGKDGEISQRCPVARMYTLMAPRSSRPRQCGVHCMAWKPCRSWWISTSPQVPRKVWSGAGLEKALTTDDIPVFVNHPGPSNLGSLVLFKSK